MRLFMRDLCYTFSLQILSQPVPVIDTMATPPPGSTPSIIPLAVGLGLAILILLVVSISLLVCLSVVWNRKKKHIVVQVQESC